MIYGQNPSKESRPIQTDADGKLLVVQDSTQVGVKIDAASALPAGGSGLIGWLSRIWLQLTLGLPAALGSALKAASIPVTIATDDPLVSNPAVVTGNLTVAVAAPTLVNDLIANTKQSISGGTVDVVTIRINSIAGGAATGTVSFFGTDDGVNLFPLSGMPIGGAIGSGSFVNSASATGAWQVKGSAARTVYAVATAIGAGATINVSLSATPNQSRVTSVLRGSLGGSVSAPAGTAPAEAVAVQSGARVVFPATIANGQSLSAALNLGSCTAARIGTPATFTGSGSSPMTFQTSHDGATWKNLYDADGNEIKVPSTGSAAVSTSYTLKVNDFMSLTYLKVRTGTSGSPSVNATGADEVFNITGLA